MTNKMPVVGQSYRLKKYPDFSVKVNYVHDVGETQHIDFGVPELCAFIYPVEFFWNLCEELPDFNSQKPEEVQVKAGEYIKTPYLPGSPKFNKWFSGKFNRCPITGGKIYDVNETPLPVEKGEVGRALEDLKFAINIDAYHQKVKSSYLWAKLREVANAAKKFVEALEAEKDKKFNIFLGDKSNLTEEEVLREVRRALMSRGQKIESIDGDVKTQTVEEFLTNQDTSKPDNQEVDDPVSIWKDVSELPRLQHLIIEYYDRFQLINDTKSLIAVRESSPKLKGCTLTEFVNEHRQMKKDIEEMKKK